MKLALCVITKGDSELSDLQNLIKTSHGAFDEVYVTANHTHTKTKAWLEKNGYHFSYLKWDDDFSKQRNFNFSQVSPDIDYIVWADCDDVIVNPEKLRDIATLGLKNNHDCVFFEYWYGALFSDTPSLETLVDVEIKHNRERLIKPGKMVWKKRIHENPEPIDETSFRYTRIKYDEDYPVAWLHLGAERAIDEDVMKKRLSRNRRLLELELEDERRDGEADPRTLLYLMKILVEEENEADWKWAIELGNEYMQKSGWDQERAVCCQLMAQCYGNMGNDSAGADLLHTAIKEYPNDVSLYLYLARAYYNMGKFREMEHWMKVGMGMEINESNTAMVNILDIKVVSAELNLLYFLHVKKNVRKASEAAKTLYKLNPTVKNKENMNYLHRKADLDKVCEGIHRYMKYLVQSQEEEKIEDLYVSLPGEIKKLPFAVRTTNKYRRPRVWGPKTVVYYASFGQPHFEKWDGRNLEKGIGGSETAVIRLSEEWAKKGYEVAVFCDCEDILKYNGVTYIPYFMFSIRDTYNILILWRHSALAGRVKARKMLVDLHDVFHESSHLEHIGGIDGIMVKSNFHRELAPSIEDNKFEIISNGI